MITFTTEEVQAMDRQTAEFAVAYAVYDATRLIEQLEREGKISGNGHHLRQQLAAAARAVVDDRWKS